MGGDSDFQQKKLLGDSQSASCVASSDAHDALSWHPSTHQALRSSLHQWLVKRLVQYNSFLTANTPLPLRAEWTGGVQQAGRRRGRRGAARVLLEFAGIDAFFSGLTGQS